MKFFILHNALNRNAIENVDADSAYISVDHHFITLKLKPYN